LIIKAVTHIHTDWSYDGHWNLSKIASFFGKLGYGLVLTSEHDRTFDNQNWKEYQKACNDASTDKTLLLPGIEYSDAENVVHVLVWNVSEFLGTNQLTGQLLHKINELKGFCVLAHPTRHNAWQQIQKSWLPLFHGIELWNRKFDGIAPSREASALWNLSNKSAPFVGLDFHRANQFFPLSLMINVNGTLSADNVFNALSNGHVYPFALGVSALYFNSGFLYSCVKSADQIRRLIAKVIKG